MTGRSTTGEQIAALSASFASMASRVDEDRIAGKQDRESVAAALRRLEAGQARQEAAVNALEARIAHIEPVTEWVRQKRGVVLGVVLTVSFIWMGLIGAVGFFREHIINLLRM